MAFAGMMATALRRLIYPITLFFQYMKIQRKGSGLFPFPADCLLWKKGKGFFKIKLLINLKIKRRNN